MKINFNSRTSQTINWQKDEPAWLIEVQREFCNDHDMVFSDYLNDFFYSTEGVKAVIAWMQKVGYSACYWELDYKLERDEVPAAYGIDILDTCPKFTELRLKI